MPPFRSSIYLFLWYFLKEPNQLRAEHILHYRKFCTFTTQDIHATEPLNKLLPLGIIQLFPKASGGRIPGKSINQSIEWSFNKITNYGKSVQVAQAGEPLAG